MCGQLTGALALFRALNGEKLRRKNTPTDVLPALAGMAKVAPAQVRLFQFIDYILDFFTRKVNHT